MVYPIGPHSNYMVLEKCGGVVVGGADLGVTTPPKRIYISKKKLCSMEASSAKGAQFQLYVNICPRDFSMTIYYF